MNDLETTANNTSNTGANTQPSQTGLLETIPNDERERVIAVMQETMFSGIAKNSNSLTDKITTDHITSIISNSDAQDKRDRDERQGQRKLHLTVFILSLAFLAFIIVFLKDDKELLYKIIIAIISFLGGIGIGKSGMIKL
jgi:hypothetical protein